MRIFPVLTTSLLIASFVFIASSTSRVSAGIDVTCFGYEPTIIGSGTIKGTSRADVIIGSSGIDVINGNGGDDFICGLGESDTIHGNSGNDSISGGSGDDSVYGDAGNDVMEADDSNEANLGDDGDDTYHGGSGDDSIFDYDGDNWANGDSGSDALGINGSAYGGSGSDSYVYAQETSDGANDGYADGGSGGETLVGVYGGTANGGSGNEIGMFATKAGDEIIAGTGSDYLEANANNVTLNGGPGKDICNPYGYTGVIFISCEITNLAP